MSEHQAKLRGVTRPSEKIRDQIEQLAAFRDAYVQLVNATKSESDGLFIRLRPDVSHSEWARLESGVARSAGAAAAAYEANGGATYTIKNAAFIMSSVNPMQNWAMSIESPE